MGAVSLAYYDFYLMEEWACCIPLTQLGGKYCPGGDGEGLPF